MIQISFSHLSSNLRKGLQTLIPLFLLISFSGVVATANGANKKFTESDACSVATSEILKKQGGENQYEIKVNSCNNFSILDIGVAHIHVVYDSSYYNQYMKKRFLTKDLDDSCEFIRSGQEWKLKRCK